MPNARTPFIIAITGASGSGKSTLGKSLAKLLGEDNCEIILLDNFYKDQPNTTLEQRAKTNYDIPSSMDAAAYLRALTTLINGRNVHIPGYSFANHARSYEVHLKEPKKYIIVDGIFALADERFRALYDAMIYVDAPMDLTFIRRLGRDIKERGRDVEGVVSQYLDTVRDMFVQYILPTRQYAGLVVNNDDKYEFTVDMNDVQSYIHALFTQKQERLIDLSMERNRMFTPMVTQPGIQNAAGATSDLSMTQ